MDKSRTGGSLSRGDRDSPLDDAIVGGLANINQRGFVLKIVGDFTKLTNGTSKPRFNERRGENIVYRDLTPFERLIVHRPTFNFESIPVNLKFHNDNRSPPRYDSPKITIQRQQHQREEPRTQTTTQQVPTQTIEERTAQYDSRRAELFKDGEQEEPVELDDQRQSRHQQRVQSYMPRPRYNNNNYSNSNQQYVQYSNQQYNYYPQQQDMNYQMYIDPYTGNTFYAPPQPYGYNDFSQGDHQQHGQLDYNYQNQQSEEQFLQFQQYNLMAQQNNYAQQHVPNYGYQNGLQQPAKETTSHIVVKESVAIKMEDARLNGEDKRKQETEDDTLTKQLTSLDITDSHTPAIEVSLPSTKQLASPKKASPETTSPVQAIESPPTHINTSPAPILPSVLFGSVESTSSSLFTSNASSVRLTDFMKDKLESKGRFAKNKCE